MNDKRKPKNEIKLNISLNEEQKAAKTLIYQNPLTLLIGSAGSGKTLVACSAALSMFFKRDIEQIIICRPAVATEQIGYLPGDSDSKLLPYLQPVLNNFYKLYQAEKIDQLLEDDVIQILPFSFMRGHTFTNSFIIADEAQNITHSQMEMVVSRLGFGSKMVICGDITQIDLHNKKDSGIFTMKKIVGELEGYGVQELKQNHRHPIVAQFLEVVKKFD